MSFKLIPLVILLCLYIFTLGIVLAKDGEDHPEYSFIGSFIGSVLTWVLIIWMIW